MQASSLTTLKLKNTSKNVVLAEHVELAQTFEERARGLLGRKTLPQDHCLWIHQCRSIHTFFMQFKIDVIFVDRNLKVTAVKKNLPKWCLAWGGFSADSCFEFKGLSVSDQHVEKGDILYVGN